MAGREDLIKGLSQAMSDGFTQTGHKLTKRVLDVKSYLQVQGLKDGFSIVSF